MRYMSVARERPPVERIVRPFQDFADKQSSGGILLLAATVIALAWANSPWAESYFALWHTKLSVGVGDFSISKDLTHWINDGLMAVFFLVVGLEIKREVLVGELSSARNAVLPVVAALGGAVVPALIYLLINAGTEGSAGWGIPMATDIAFALGVLALLGERAPTTLKVFVTALAIVDDTVAVLVIALFYTSEISWGPLGGGSHTKRADERTRTVDPVSLQVRRQALLRACKSPISKRLSILSIALRFRLVLARAGP